MNRSKGGSRRGRGVVTLLATLVLSAVFAGSASADQAGCDLGTYNVIFDECQISGPTTATGVKNFHHSVHMLPGSSINASGGGITLNINGASGLDFTMDTTSSVIEANDDGLPSGASASPININATGDMEMQAGARILAENANNGGSGGNITIDVDGDLTMAGAVGLVPGAIISTRKSAGAGDTGLGGNITIMVGDSTAATGTFFMGGGSTTYGAETGAKLIATGTGPAGDITVNAGRTYTTEPGSVVEAGDGNGTTVQQGGKIFLASGCGLTTKGRVTSKGTDPGADLVHIEACDVLIAGLVESTGRAHATGIRNSCDNVNDGLAGEVLRPGKPAESTACIEVWANNVTIDSTNGNAGELNADIGNGGSGGRSWIDVFAFTDLTVKDGSGNNRTSSNGGGSYLNTFAVHAKSIGGSDNTPNTITAKAKTGVLTVTGDAFQAGSDGNGSNGGSIVLQSSGNATLDTSLEASSGGGAAGDGGSIAVRSFNGNISWQNGEGDVTGSPNGTISLTSCGTVNTAGSNFHSVSVTTASSCGGMPSIPGVSPDYTNGFFDSATRWDNCNEEGTIIVEKQTVPDGATGNFTFTGDAAGTISDGQQIVVSGLTAGTYTSTEADPSPGFDLTDIQCTDSDNAGVASSGDTQTRTATINLDPGETVSCTFENTERGKVVITKDTIPNGPQDFTYTDTIPNGCQIGPLDDDSDNTNPNNTTCLNVTPGTYSVTEDDPTPGFDLTDLTCTDSDAGGTDSTGSTATRTATINLDPGETVSCTFENTERGKVVITKDTIPNGPQDFTYTDTIPNGCQIGPLDDDSDNTNPNNTTCLNVTPGTYSVTEDDPTPGFDLTDLTCTDSDAGGTDSTGSTATRTATINLDPGETVSCTFENTERGKVVITKDTIPNGPQDFTYTDTIPNGCQIGPLDDDSDNTNPNNTTCLNVTPGTYSVTEDDPTPGFDLTDLTCTDSDAGGTDSTGSTATRTATINLDPGETVSCTFENTERGKVVITKDTIPNGPQDFTYTDTIPNGCQIGPLDDDSDNTNPNNTTCLNVTPGTYSVTEDDPTPGFDLTDLTCTDSDAGGTDSTGSTATRTATINLDPGETVSCTFENTERGKVVITKDTIPNGPQDFTYTDTIPNGCQIGPLDDDSDNTNPNNTTCLNVTPGTYSVTEDDPTPGFDLTDLTCTDSDAGGTDSTGSTATRTATINLDPGETVSCTFENTERGKVVITKDTIPNGPQDFTYTDTIPNGCQIGPLDDDSDNTNPNNTTCLNVTPGTYSVTEDDPTPGFDLTDLTCTDSDAGGTDSTGSTATRTATINLDPGETVSCTFENTERGKVVITKDTIPNGPQDFTYTDTIPNGCQIGPLDDDSDNTNPNNTTCLNVTPGTYSVTEDDPTPGFDLTDLTCTDSDAGGTDSTGSTATRTATINLDPGETVSCTFENTERGKVVITKDTIPNGPQDFTYTDTIPNGCQIGPLDDDSDNTNPNNTTCLNVTPGTYSVTEDDPTPGFDLTDLTCTDSDAGGTDSTGSTATRTATINLDPGETVSCTFENTERGKVVITKDTIPNGPQDFTYTDTIPNGCQIGPLDDDSDNTNPNNTTCLNVTPGTYSVTEDDPTPGFDLTDLTCTDSDAGGTDSTGSTATRTATINLDPGETVSCTFENTERGKVVITKDTIPNGPQDFTYTDTIPNGCQIGPLDDDSDNTNPNNTTCLNVTPGTYSVTEDDPTPGFDLTDLTCTDSDAGGTDSTGSTATRTATINLDPGETVSCTFENTERGKVVITKDTIPNGPQDFTYTDTIPNGCQIGPLDDDSDNTNPNNTTCLNVTPGTYSVTEDDPTPGFDLTDLTCTDSDAGGTDSTGSTATRTATINLDPGETVSCTFENTERGKVVITKDTIPNGPQDFTYTDTIPNGCQIGPLDDDSDNTNPNNTTCLNVTPGTYSVTEDDPTPGFDLTDLTCTDSDAGGTDSTGSTATRTATINLDPGETVSCTFENTERGKVVITKDTIPNGPQDFTYTDTIPNGCQIGPLDDDSDNTNPNNTTCLNVTPGTYSVTEDDPTPGFDLTDLTCTDSDAGGTDSTGSTATRTATINLDPGETVSCTFENTEDATVTITKDAIPDGPPGLQLQRPPASTAPDRPFTLERRRQRDKRAGDSRHRRRLAEDQEVHVLRLRLRSEDDHRVGPERLDELRLQLAPRAPRVERRPRTSRSTQATRSACNYENTKDATVTITKDAIPDSGQDFRFSTTGSGLAPFTLEDDGNETNEPATPGTGGDWPKTKKFTFTGSDFGRRRSPSRPARLDELRLQLLRGHQEWNDDRELHGRPRRHDHVQLREHQGRHRHDHQGRDPGLRPGLQLHDLRLGPLELHARGRRQRDKRAGDSRHRRRLAEDQEVHVLRLRLRSEDDHRVGPERLDELRLQLLRGHQEWNDDRELHGRPRRHDHVQLREQEERDHHDHQGRDPG